VSKTKKHEMISPKRAAQYECVIVHIDEIIVHDGDRVIDSEVWQWQDDAEIKLAFEELLPYPIYSHSHPAFNINASYAEDFLKKGIYGRYIKISDRQNMTRMLFLDNDDPNYNSWRGVLPHPNIVIINPLTLHSHVGFFLSEEVDLYSPRYKALKRAMSQRLGGDVDEKNVGERFRSPFFFRQENEWFYLKNDILQPDFHYNIIHEGTWTKLYSLSELEESIRVRSLDELFGTESDTLAPYITTNEATVVRPSIPPYNNMDKCHFQSQSANPRTSGRNFMYDNGYKKALKHYRPDLPEDTVKTLMRAEFEVYGQGVQEVNILEAVRYCYEKAKKGFDASKRRVFEKSMTDEAFSGLQSVRSNMRPLKLYDGDPLEIAIKKSGKSRRQFFRDQKKGPKLPKAEPWKALNMSRTRFYALGLHKEGSQQVPVPAEQETAIKESNAVPEAPKALPAPSNDDLNRVCNRIEADFRSMSARDCAAAWDL
jgi:hypothetical protein